MAHTEITIHIEKAWICGPDTVPPGEVVDMTKPLQQTRPILPESQIQKEQQQIQKGDQL